MNPAAEARAKVKADHPEAVVVERRRNSIKHRLADHVDGRRRFALDVAIGPLHYGPGNDQEVDTALVPSTAPWDWEMTKAGFEVRALSRLDAGQVIEYRNTEWVRFQPMALQYSNDLNQIQQISMPQAVDATVDDDTLSWMDGYGPGRSLSWQAQTARLAKLLTINAPSDLPAVDQFILDGGNPVLELNLVFALSGGVTPYVNGQAWGKGGATKEVETQSLVEFRDGGGNILWWFNLPHSWDADGNGQLGTFRLRKVGNSLYVSHRVPLSFVQGAVYPLMVDTTIDEQVGAGADDAHEQHTGGGFTSTASFIKMDDDFGDAFRFISGSRFSSVAIGNADTIDVATMDVNVLGTSTDDASVNIHGEDVDAADDFSTTADVFSRTKTAASTEWTAASIGAGWNTSPGFISAVQEVVDRGGWASGNAMVIFLTGRDAIDNQPFRAKSYDGDTALAPKLHIEYTGVGGETRSLAGSQPAATGVLARVEQGIRALAGSQPAATGTLARVEKAVRALAGAQPTATGLLTYRRVRSLAGSQPAATGALTRIKKAKRAVVGDQPAATGALARVEKAVRALAGSQPAATGTLSYSRTRSLTGDQPNPTGTLASVWTGVRALAGSQPAATGALARVMAAFRATAGSQPAATGVLSRIEQALRALAGDQPNPTGTLTRQHKRLRSLAGDQPAAIGILTAEITVVKRTLAGSQPAPTGALASKYQAIRAIAGNQPAPTGVLTRYAQVSVALVGSQPASVGALIRSKAFARALAGSQPTATGILTVSVLELLSVVDAHARLAVSIAGARAVRAERVIEASAVRSVYVPIAHARRNGEED